MPLFRQLSQPVTKLVVARRSMKKASILWTVVFLIAQTSQSATYYVAKSGSDSNSGIATNLAFLTIQKAATVMNAGDTCYIFSGTYRETVTPAHSGALNSPITFAAYPGETPVVSGADVLTGTWTVYSNSIYQLTTTRSFRQLFVDGKMMNEARWPNAVVDNLLTAPRSTPSSCTLTNLVDASLPNVNLLGATLHIFPNEFNNQGYAANTRQITAWDPVAKKISWNGNIFNSGAVNTLYYIYGALSLLDIPTEWYLDDAGNTLYLWTPDGASPTNHVVEVKARTNAFTLDNLSYVTVSGIYVFGAGISMNTTTQCMVDRCNLIYVQHNTTADWTVSVPIVNQVSGTGSVWQNSTIRFSSQDGIRFSGLNEVVSNCVIQQVDYYPGTYYAAVTAFHLNGGPPTNGTKIVNNTLTYSGRYCVGSSSPGIEIAYNDLGFGDLLTSDGGAEYVYVGGGDGAGTSIHHNWMHNSWAGVYIDALQNNYLVYRNVCYSNYIGMLFNQATNNLIINNTSASNTSEDLLLNGPDTNVSLINNIWQNTQINHSGLTESHNGWYPPLGTNYVPQAGSGAINGGAVDSPYTDGFIGIAPDVGAYEVGGDFWVPGANFTPQPFPNPILPPVIVTQPLSQTSYLNETATFNVNATSVGAISYQWQAGTTGGGIFSNLTESGQVSGVTGASLSISNLTFDNASDYLVVVSNSNGSVTSSVATLTVLDPAPSVSVQPISQTNIVGQSVTFSAAATGLAPLYYQWQAGAHGSGIYTNLLAGGQSSVVTNAALTISNLVSGNAGDYTVVASNAFGSITSAVAVLTVVTNSGYRATVLADHPVSYWPLNETSGTLIHDVVGANNGTCMNPNGMTLGGPGVLYGQGVTSDTAIYFTNTSSAYIKVPYSSTLNNPKFTVEAWLKMPVFPVAGAGVDMNAVSMEDSSSPKGWTFEINNASAANPNMYGWIGHSAWTQLSSGTCIQGQWSYYALTYDGTTFTVYTNGVAAVSGASSYTLPSSLHSFYMGSYDSSGTPGRFFQGGMENVALYSNALTSSQILNHYQVGITGISSPPVVSIQPSGANVVVSWTEGFLQQSSSLNGPWTYVTNAASPYTQGASNSIQFFRGTLQSP